MTNRILLGTMMATMIMAFIACWLSTPTTISLNSASTSLIVPSTYQLVATVAPSSQKVSWTSYNPSIASVDSDTGLITAAGAGVTWIFATTAGIASADADIGLITGVGAGLTWIVATVAGPQAAFAVSVWRLDGNGNLQFKADETSFYGWYWIKSAPGQTAQPLQGHPVTVIAKKISGASNCGFGVVFCKQDDHNFYVAEISSGGEFEVRRLVNDDFSTLVPWTPSSHIVAGYSQPNTISVSQPSAGTLSLSINGTPVSTFSDSTYSDGTTSFYASIGSSADESFPATPEDIRFKISAPIVYP